MSQVYSLNYLNTNIQNLNKNTVQRNKWNKEFNIKSLSPNNIHTSSNSHNKYYMQIHQTQTITRNTNVNKKNIIKTIKNHIFNNTNCNNPNPNPLTRDNLNYKSDIAGNNNTNNNQHKRKYISQTSTNLVKILEENKDLYLNKINNFNKGVKSNNYQYNTKSSIYNKPTPTTSNSNNQNQPNKIQNKKTKILSYVPINTINNINKIQSKHITNQSNPINIINPIMNSNNPLNPSNIVNPTKIFSILSPNNQNQCKITTTSPRNKKLNTFLFDRFNTNKKIVV